MPHTPPDLILMDGVTTATAGPALGIGGQGMRYGNKVGTRNLNQYPIPFKVRVTVTDSVSGGTASVPLQTSPDGTTWTTIYTFPLVVGTTLQGTSGKLFKSAARYIRLGAPTIAGGATPTVSGYCTLGTFGI